MRRAETTVSFAVKAPLNEEKMEIVKAVLRALDTEGTIFIVQEKISDWTKEDVRQSIEAIVKGKTFFFAGDDELGDEVRKFLVDHPIYSNLENLVEEGEAK